VASGYLSRLRTCKITRPCQAATNGDPIFRTGRKDPSKREIVVEGLEQLIEVLTAVGVEPATKSAI
jgi:hypothetical protein